MDEVNNTVSEYVTLPRAWYTLNGSVLCIVALAASIQNIAVLLTFFKRKNLRTPHNVFIISVSVGDIITACVIPLSATSNFSQKWIHGDFWCTAEAFIVYVAGMANIYCITATAVQRYLIVAKWDNQTFVNMKATVITLIFAWLAALCWAIAPLAGWNAYGLEGAKVSCGLDWRRKDIGSQVYVILLFVLGFVFPLGTMIFCYGSIYRKVARSSANLRAAKQRDFKRKNVRIAKTAFILTCGFFIAWTPYAIVSLWAAFGDATKIPIWLVSSPALFAKCSCVWNPLIYAGTNKKFINGFIDILPCGGLRKALKKGKSTDLPLAVRSRTPTTKKSLFAKLLDEKANLSFLAKPPSHDQKDPIRLQTDDQKEQNVRARTAGSVEDITPHIQTDDPINELSLEWSSEEQKKKD